MVKKNKEWANRGPTGTGVEERKGVSVHMKKK